MPTTRQLRYDSATASKLPVVIPATVPITASNNRCTVDNRLPSAKCPSHRYPLSRMFVCCPTKTQIPSVKRIQDAFISDTVERCKICCQRKYQTPAAAAPSSSNEVPDKRLHELWKVRRALNR